MMKKSLVILAAGLWAAAAFGAGPNVSAPMQKFDAGEQVLCDDVDATKVVQVFTNYEAGITKMGLTRQSLRSDIQPALLTRETMDLVVPLRRGWLDASAELAVTNGSSDTVHGDGHQFHARTLARTSTSKGVWMDTVPTAA